MILSLVIKDFSEGGGERGNKTSGVKDERNMVRKLEEPLTQSHKSNSRVATTRKLWMNKLRRLL